MLLLPSSLLGETAGCIDFPVGDCINGAAGAVLENLETDDAATCQQHCKLYSGVCTFFYFHHRVTTNFTTYIEEGLLVVCRTRRVLSAKSSYR